MNGTEAIQVLEEILERAEKLKASDAVVFFFYSRIQEIEDNARYISEVLHEIEEKEK